MKSIDKKFILQLISEQISNMIENDMEMDEMAGRSRPAEDWDVDVLPEGNEFIKKVDNPRWMSSEDAGREILCSIPTYDKDHPQDWQAKNPGVNPFPYEKNVVVSNVVRTSPNGKIMYQFVNFIDGGRNGRGKKNYYDPERNLFYNADRPPRNAYYGTTYVKQESISPEERIKRYAIFPLFNSFFKNPEISSHLRKCGIPPIFAIREAIEPITLRIKEAVFTPPNFNFEFNNTFSAENIESYIDSVSNFRLNCESGEEADDFMNRHQKHKRRYAGRRYTGGYWSGAQPAYSEDEFISHGKKTPEYCLNKKDIKEGLIKMNLVSILGVNTKLTGNVLDTYFVFKSVKNVRPEGRSRAKETGNLFEPIHIAVSSDHDTYNTIEDIKSMFNNALSELYDRILEINPDDTLSSLINDINLFTIEDEANVDAMNLQEIKNKYRVR